MAAGIPIVGLDHVHALGAGETKHENLMEKFKCRICVETFTSVSYTHLTLPTIYSV